MKSILGKAAVAGAALLVMAGPAVSAPTVTMTSPADGATVSRSATPNLAMAGAVSFATPSPSDLDLFLRNPDANCAGYALSTLNGADAGNGCSFIAGSASIVPGQENTFVENYASDESIATPLTIDGSRPVTGSIAISSVTPNAVIFEVGVVFDGTVIGTRLIDTGVYTSSYILESSPTYPFSIPIPAAMDKKDVSSVAITITWKRYPINATSTWVELEDPPSTMSIPTFTASFDRKVQVAANGGAFTSTGVTLSADLKSWSATMGTPPIGSHFIKAQAVQGGIASGIAQNVLHVTA